MIELVYYLLLMSANVIALALVVRWRGLWSFEGYGCALLGLVLTTDVFGVLVAAAPALTSATAMDEYRLRIIPALIHLLGVVAFAAGLGAAAPHPVPVRCTVQPSNAPTIARIGMIILVLGLGMKLLSMYGEGIGSIGAFFQNMYAYTVSQRRFGGFLDSGVSIALFGLALVAAARVQRPWQMFGLLAVGISMSFFLTSSRAGINDVVVTFIAVSMIFRHRSWEYLRRPSTLALLVVLWILTAGIKSQIRTKPLEDLDLSFNTIQSFGLDRFGSRFGSRGLFYGYSLFVTRMSASPLEQFDGSVLNYTLTGWVPRLLYPDKPENPFRDIGRLINEDYSSTVLEVSAPTLVGYAYADFGLVSVVLYPLVGGLIVGLIRRAAVRPERSMFVFVGYAHFAIIEGGSNVIHHGLLGFFDGAALAVGTMGVVGSVLALRSIARSASGKMQPQLQGRLDRPTIGR